MALIEQQTPLTETRPVGDLARDIFVANNPNYGSPDLFGIAWDDLQVTGVVEDDEADVFSGIPLIEGAQVLTAYAYAQYIAQEDSASQTLRLLIRNFKQTGFYRAVPPTLRVPLGAMRPQELEIRLKGVDLADRVSEPDLSSGTELTVVEGHYQWEFDRYIEESKVTVFRERIWDEKRIVEPPNGFDGFVNRVVGQMLQGGGYGLPTQYISQP